MPLLRSLNSFGADFYKDVAPTALRKRRQNRFKYEAEAQAVMTDAIIKKVFNTVP